MIEITEIRTRPIHRGRTAAHVRLVLNDMVTLKVRVMRGGYVWWPLIKGVADHVGPLEPGACREANELILGEYAEAVEKGK